MHVCGFVCVSVCVCVLGNRKVGNGGVSLELSIHPQLLLGMDRGGQKERGKKEERERGRRRERRERQ